MEILFHVEVNTLGTYGIWHRISKHVDIVQFYGGSKAKPQVLCDLSDQSRLLWEHAASLIMLFL